MFFSFCLTVASFLCQVCWLVTPSPDIANKDALLLRGIFPESILPVFESLILGYANNRSEFVELQGSQIPVDFERRTDILQELDRNEAILTVDSLEPPSTASGSNLQVIPVAMAAFSFVYNLPGSVNASELVLGLRELAAIYDGSLNYWDDPRIQKLNPCKSLSLSHKRIILVLRDDRDLVNLVLTSFLSTISPQWRRRYGALDTFKNWKLGHSSLHTFRPTGVVSLVNAVSYTLGYLLAYEPTSLTVPLVHIILSSGQLVKPTPETCAQTVLHGNISLVTDAVALLISDDLSGEKAGTAAVMETPPYPLVVLFRAFVRRHLDTPPYPIQGNGTGHLPHLSDACRLQVELYGFLQWLLHSRVAYSILRSKSLFTQASWKAVTMEELTCVNGPSPELSQSPSAAAAVTSVPALYANQRETEAALSSALEEGRRDLFLTVCITSVIILVVLLLLLRHFRIHRYSTSRFLVDMEDLRSLDSDSHLVDGVCRMQNNFTAYEKILPDPAGSRKSQHPLQSVWIYADTVLSTAPTYRTYRSKDVLLYPTNMTTSARFTKEMRGNLQRYLEMDHENVQSFFGLTRVPEQCVVSRRRAGLKNSLRRKLRLVSRLGDSRSCGEGRARMASGRRLGCSETDFILPWIYYAVVEEGVRGSLFELLHSGQYNICQPLKLTLASDIAGGMAYLHSKQLIHGRLSSMTCLLDSQWVLKIASWQRLTEFIQTGRMMCLTAHGDDTRATRFLKKAVEAGPALGSRPRIRVAEKPMYLRIMWKSPAQLRAYIAASTGAENETKKTPQSILDPEYVDFLLRKKGQMGSFEQRAVFRTYACDVYSFGVILTEIWSLEVPFQDSLSSFLHEVQLAEAISLGTIRLSVPISMPSRIRHLAETCIDHTASVRPKFRNILKTLASLVPAGRSIGHHMLRAANIRTNDLKANIAVENLEVSRQRQQLCNKLDNLFPRDYCQKIIAGLPPPDPELSTIVVCVVGLVQVDEAPALGASEKDHMISEVRQEFRSRLPSPLESCSVNAAVHMSAAFTGLIGVYLPRHTVFGHVVPDTVELRRQAGPAEVLVTATTMEAVSNAAPQFTFKETRKIVLWVCLLAGNDFCLTCNSKTQMRCIPL
nr:unnamed protein product [Spirometra erinaceieuropaei]